MANRYIFIAILISLHFIRFVSGLALQTPGAAERVLWDASGSEQTAIASNALSLIPSSFGDPAAVTPFFITLAARQGTVPSTSTFPTSKPPGNSTSIATGSSFVPSSNPSTTRFSATPTSVQTATSSAPASGSGGNNNNSSFDTGTTVGAAVGGAAGGLVIVAIVIWWKWSSIKSLASRRKSDEDGYQVAPAGESVEMKDFSIGNYDTYPDASGSTKVTGHARPLRRI